MLFLFAFSLFLGGAAIVAMSLGSATSVTTNRLSADVPTGPPRRNAIRHKADESGDPAWTAFMRGCDPPECKSNRA